MKVKECWRQPKAKELVNYSSITQPPLAEAQTKSAVCSQELCSPNEYMIPRQILCNKILLSVVVKG